VARAIRSQKALGRSPSAGYIPVVQAFRPSASDGRKRSLATNNPLG
jgi:hypothetical protein